MDRTRRNGFVAIILIIVLVAVVAATLSGEGLISLSGVIQSAFDALLGGTAVAVGAILVSMYPDSRVVRLFHGKREIERVAESQRPTVTLEVLPHEKGHSRFDETSGRAESREALLYRASARPAKTTEEAWQLAGSQEWSSAKRTVTAREARRGLTFRTRSEIDFLAKFGVVRVFSESGPAVDCQATSHVKVLKDPSGRMAENRIIGTGDLDWYSEKLRNHFLESRRLKRRFLVDPTQGLSKYVPNPKVTIPRGGYADLPLFYTVGKHPPLLIWGSQPRLIAATFEGNKQAKFEIEVTVVGSNFDPVTRAYSVVARPDDFEMTRVK